MPPAARKKGRGRPAKPENAKSSAVSNTQKPRKPLSGLIPPKTKPVNGPFTQKQSYEQLKILSLVVLSRIAAVRVLFPKLKYLLRQYDPADPETTYEAFVGQNSGFVPVVEGLSMWKVLPRGVHDGADKVLDWLEISVSAALELGYLKKFDLSIHSDDGKPAGYANKIESYTLSFTYGSDPQIELASMDNGNKNAGAVSLLTAKDKVRSVVEIFGDKLSNGIAEFPPLPRGHCRLAMSLLFNEDCPRGYLPPLFKAGDIETSRLLHASNTAAKTSLDYKHALSIQTGFHGVNIGWSISLQPSESFHRNPSGAALDNEIQCIARQPSILGKRPLEISEQAGRIQHGLRSSSNMAQPKSPSELRIPPGLGGTQIENIRRFRGMQRHRSKRDSTQDTLPLHNSSSPIRASASRIEQATSQKIHGLLPYSQEIINLVKKTRRTARFQGNRDEPVRPNLACACESTNTEEDLIECEICATHQHYPCYGYDFERPKTHVCYQCLFRSSSAESDHGSSGDMAHLCVTRRALYYIQKLGPSPVLLSMQELGQYLGCSQNMTNFVLQSLAEQDLVEFSRMNGDVECSFVNGVHIPSILDPQKNIEQFLDRSKKSMATSQIGSMHSTRFSLRGPPSFTESDSQAVAENLDWTNESAISNLIGSDTSTTDEDIFSPPHKSSEIKSALTRQAGPNPEGSSLNRKRTSDSFSGRPNSKKLKFEQTGKSAAVTLNNGW